MKIFINRKIIKKPWGGGAHFVTNFAKYLELAGHEVVFDFVTGIDIMFMIDPRPNSDGHSINDMLQYKHYFPNTKIVHRINECDKRKNTNFIDKMIVESNKFADSTIFISKWLKDYYFQKGITQKSSVIYNGCNLDHFHANEKNKDISKKIKLVTHHWSDNWMKGFDIYTAIDKFLKDNNSQFEFTYIGRYNKDYNPENTTVISPMYGKELGDELRKHDIYVTASRFEPCGMHHIEGAASGLPVLFHEDGGGINDLCHNHGLSFNSFDDFLRKLNEMKLNYSNFVNKINYNQLGSDYCNKKYNEVLEGLLN